MEIIWPEGYNQKNTSVHISNEIEARAPREVLWAWLVRAPLWQEWYPTVSRVALEGGVRELRLGTKFSWRIFGVTLSSVVEEFVPEERIAWSAKFEGVDAYHAWLIEARDTGCRVLTEENQKGWLARLNNALRPSNARYYHYLWLEALKKKAEEGPPPAP